MQKWQWIALLAILGLATFLRLHSLATDSLWHDELWAMEMTLGHDAQQNNLRETSLLAPPPDMLSLEGAAPWPQIWTHMHGDTHPPLYHTALRFWRELFGSSELAVRSLSVIFSLAAILALFDAARTLHQTTIALWACLLMALAAPQIQYAQEARSYAPLLLEGLLAIAAVARLEKRGPSIPCAILLCGAVLAMPLTHYFSAGAIMALAIYTALRLRGRAFIQAAAAFTLATLLGIIIWAHEFLMQRPNFADSPLVNWLHETRAHPTIVTLARVLLLPSRYLADTDGPVKALATFLALLLILPPLARRRYPQVMLWWLWLVGTIAPVVALDLLDKSKHLALIRYTLLASPAIYVLLATAAEWAWWPSFWRRQKWIVPAIASACCVVALPTRAYHPAWRPDWRSLFQEIAQRRQPREPVCCVGPGTDGFWDPDGIYIELNYYLRPLPAAVVLIQNPTNESDAPPVNDLLRNATSAWAVVLGTTSAPGWPPAGWVVDTSIDHPGVGRAEHIRRER